MNRRFNLSRHFCSMAGILALFFFTQKTTAQSLIFAKDLGHAATDLGMAMDSDGNIFMAGTAITGTDLDPSPASEHLLEGIAGKKTAFVVKLNGAGQFVWAVSLGVENADAGPEIPGSDRLKIGKNGRVHAIFALGGFSNDKVYFWPGGSELTTVGGSVVLTIDADGQFISILDAFISSNGGGTYRKFHDLDVLPDGQVVVAGSFTGYLYPGTPSVGIQSKGLTDGFLIKYDPADPSASLKARGFGSAKAEHITGVGTDAAGNIYLGGDYSGTFDIDPSPTAQTFLNLFSSQGPMDGFLVKLDSALNFIKAVEVNATIAGDFKVEAGTNGRVAVSTVLGSTPSLFDFSNALTDEGGMYKPPSEQTTSGLQNEYLKLARDGSGGVYAMSGFVDTTGGAAKMWFGVTKNAASGGLAWEFRVRGASLFGNGFEATGLAVSADGKTLTVAGFFDGSVDFDPSSGEAILTAPTGQKRAFLLKFSDPCPDLAIHFLENKAVGCAENGRVRVSATGGKAPYFFEWKTTPPVFDSVLTVPTGGFFGIKMTDATGCERQTQVFVNQPTSLDPTVFDARAEIFGASDFRPGFGASFFVAARNPFCQSKSGELRLTLDPKMTLTGAAPPPDFTVGDTLVWAFDSLRADILKMADIYVLLSPLAPLGDSVCLRAEVRPSDFEPKNNVFLLKKTIIGSFDPNDIAASPAGVCAENAILPNGKMQYTVRFQNTGTASAINIRVLDTLQKSLDLNSLRVIASSHPMGVERPDSSVLAFVFDEINLPDSFSNEAASHGFVVFELDQKPNLPDGTKLENRAAIYFDFNVPVITNSVFQTIREVLPSCPTVSTGGFLGEKGVFDVFPNPIGHGEPFQILLENDFLGTVKIELFSLDGRLFSFFEKEKTARRQVFEIEKDLPIGAFFIRVSDGKNTAAQLVLKF